ncbi:hypothetical protein BKA70DRAFT_1424489 [Coprinopsis sp. MPI-PUGE-AT-0042]|nr:hypothetical protein BKA70DRAFT_1424489 [Coprinopsis sp. MPI-PUGE-AT-0042]
MSTTASTVPPPMYNKAVEAGDPPPPYTDEQLQQMVVQAYEEFEKKHKENPAAANAALAKALGDTASSTAFVKDMDSLRLKIGCLNTLFDKVHTGLATVDAEKLKGQDGTVVAWQPKWSPICQDYLDTMTKSRSLATSLSSHCEMFFKNVLPKLKDDNLTPQQKDDMLTYFLGEKVTAMNYNKVLKKDEDDAEQMYKDFQRVQTNVKTFQAQFKVWWAQAKAELQKEITELQGDIAKIDADIDTLTTKRNIVLGVTGGGVVVAGIGGVMMATGVLAPVGAFLAVLGALAALGSGIAAAVLQSQIADKQAEKNNKQAELTALLAKQQRVNTVLEPLVASLDTDMTSIAEKLETMKSIWSFIKAQAQTARIDVTQSIDSEAPSFLKEDLLEASIASYKVLNTCVKMYGEGFNN